MRYTSDCVIMSFKSDQCTLGGPEIVLLLLIVSQQCDKQQATAHLEESNNGWSTIWSLLPNVKGNLCLGVCLAFNSHYGHFKMSDVALVIKVSL